MKKLIYIFGTKETAECAFYDITKYDSDAQLCGFIEDSPVIHSKYDLPVYSTENFLKLNLQNKISLFLPLSKNRIREKNFIKFKNLGFKFYTFISPMAKVADNVLIGENCYVQEFNNIQFGSIIGNNCILWASNHIGHHTKIGNSVFLASHVCISGRNDIGDRSYFGSNSTTRDGLNICDETILGMASSLILNTKKSGVYVGNPANLKIPSKIERYI